MANPYDFFKKPPQVTPEDGGIDPAAFFTRPKPRLPWEDPNNPLRLAGALPHDEMDDGRDRTFADYLRRVSAAAVSGPADTLAFEQTALRAVVPDRFEEMVVQGVTGAKERALEGVQAAVPIVPLTHDRQQRERDRFRGLSGDENPWVTAGLDTAAEAAGLVLDPTNLIPAGSAAKGAARGAARVAPRVAGAVDDLAPPAARAISPELQALADASERIGAPPPVMPAVPPPVVPPRRPVGPLTYTHTPAADGTVTIAAFENGREVGWAKAKPQSGGYHLDWVENTSGQSGDEVAGVGTALHEELSRLTGGPRLGELTNTPDGQKLVDRLRETRPELVLPVELSGKIPGAPRVAGPDPPIVTPQFQTNLVAQTGSQEVFDYIVHRSDEVAKAIGGPQGWDEVEQMALRLGTTKEEFLARPTKFAQMAPEDRLRLTYVIKGTDDDIATLQAKLAADEASDLDKANLLRLIDERGSLIKLAVGVGSEYGRALNTLRMASRATLGESSLARQALYRRYKDNIDDNQWLLNDLSKLDPTNPDELMSFLRKVDIPKFREYAREYWIASVLSGPATHIRNFIGNTANAFAENLLVRPLRAALDPVFAKAQGRAREHYMAEVPAAAYGFGAGMIDGVAKGFEILRRGYDMTNEATKLLPTRSAFARSSNRVVREYVGPVVTMPLRLLAASDAVYKTMNHRAELYAQAANMASKEGLRGEQFASRVAELVDTPTPAMIDAANQFALKATFNDPVSNIGKAWMNLRSEVPGGTFLSPFVKIADRLMARGFEYTPAGFVKAARAKGADATDLSARAALGSTAMMGAAVLAGSGRLTASAPTDAGERDVFYRSGKKPWAVRLPMAAVEQLVSKGTLTPDPADPLTPDGDGDVWVPFAQIQPLATPLAATAAAYKGWQETGEEPVESQLLSAAIEVGTYVTDQSYMNSLSDFFAAFTGRGNAAAKQQAIGSFVQQIAGGFMPFSGLNRSLAQAVDPRLIDVRTIKGKMLSQVPGASVALDLPARLDVWGEEIVPASGRARGIMATGTPLDASVQETSPLDAELQRIGVSLGFVDKRVFNPELRQTVKLSQADYHRYQQMAGSRTKALLTDLFADPRYQQADAESQRQAAEEVIGAARQYARMELLFGDRK